MNLDPWFDIKEFCFFQYSYSLTDHLDLHYNNFFLFLKK